MQDENHSKKLYSVLHAYDEGGQSFTGEIVDAKFASYEDAMDFIRTAGVDDGDYGDKFDLDNQYVYIMTPDHKLIHISSYDIKENE